MKYILLIATLLLSRANYAQLLNTFQTDSGVKWEKLDSNLMTIYYPNNMEEQAQYILKLSNYYFKLVSKDFNRPPEKVDLVLRNNVSIPNGFVTLARRRTEWFAHQNISPITGGLSWYESLAVHELRHVMQMDFMKRSNLKTWFYLYGEIVFGNLVHIALPSWYFEGDAVDAETRYTYGGRGRSPRFSSRMKAVLNNKIPSYDQFLAGTKENNLPNHYVYGYVLIKYGRETYGDNFWTRVIARTSDSPFNPYAFYAAIEGNSGESFQQFYDNAMKSFSSDISLNQKNKEVYKNQILPSKKNEKLFYLEKGLNSFWTLKKNDNQVETFNIIPRLSRPLITDSSFIYTQYIQDSRYGTQNYSDLFIYEIESGKTKRITKDQHHYHPQIFEDTLSTISKDDANNFYLTLFDLKMNYSRKEINLLKNRIPLQHVWIDQENVVILNEKNRYKYLTIYNLQNNLYTDILGPTLNNINDFTINDKTLFFEADAPQSDSVEIFSMNLDDHQIKQCTQSLLGSYSPDVHKDLLYYSKETLYGKRIYSQKLNCQNIERAFFDTELTTIDKIPYKKMTVSEFDKFETPYAWSFLGPGGYQLGLQSSNILNTLNVSGLIGYSTNEQTPYASMTASYAKYYPIFDLGLNFQKQSREVLGKKYKWDEFIAYFGTTIPYTSNIGFTTQYFTISPYYEYIFGEKSQYSFSDELSGNHINATGLKLSYNINKKRLPQQIWPQYAIGLNIDYKNIEIPHLEKQGYLAKYNFNFYLPGFTNLQSHYFEFAKEEEQKNETSFSYYKNYRPVFTYQLSRGYQYDDNEFFEKMTYEYKGHISYPKVNIYDLLFIKRISGSVFYDSTKIKFRDNNREEFLNSLGSEIYFNTNTLRTIELDYGYRYYYKEKNHEQGHEVFLSTSF